MANRFQQQSLRRKIVYIGLIVALFTATILLRTAQGYGVEAVAKRLQLREEDLGDVELTDRAVRLLLTGSRGFAVCGMWYAREQKKIKHEWNEVELLTRSVIKLQPHFVTPWLFQSWDLAYNVSVECDRVRDKYFYVTRGIEFLAEGDRQNRGNPDVRFYTGIYTQNKMGISDEQNTMRSLFQMSCIDPVERDPRRFREPDAQGVPQIKWDNFEEFCQRHPHLIRRLHDHLRCRTADDIINFLADNQNIPGWFQPPRPTDVTEGKASAPMPLAERFPCLPPRSNFDENELTNDGPPLTDDIDNYAVARAWFGYAQDPLRLPAPDTRKPRYMAQIIFEGYPARAQAYIGERREKEGWFDADGWQIKDWFPADRSQPDGERRTITVGIDHNWAVEAWDRAFQMYIDHGKRHELYPPKTVKEVRAMSSAEQLAYGNDAHLSNYAHFYSKCDVEKNVETVTARKYIYKAEELRRNGDYEPALENYERAEAFPTWKRILLAHPDYRNDEDVQEETYNWQWNYAGILRERRSPTIKRLLVVQDLLTQGAIGSPAVRMWVPIHLRRELPVPYQLPFFDLDPEGQPILAQKAIDRAIRDNETSSTHRTSPPPKPGSPAPPSSAPSTPATQAH